MTDVRDEHLVVCIFLGGLALVLPVHWQVLYLVGLAAAYVWHRFSMREQARQRERLL